MWRTFDVGAVVESLPSSDAEVVAGTGGLHRRVVRARIANTSEHLRRAGADEVIVMTEDTLVSVGQSWAQTVNSLNAAHVAAIAIGRDGDEPLPPALLEAADGAALPLITFSGATALADVTTAVLDALLSAQSRRLEQVFEIHQRFTPIVLAGGGAPEIAATLHGVVGHPVAVFDADDRLITVVPSDVVVDDVAAIDGVRQPVLADDHRYGEIVVLNGGRRLDHDHALALERASTALALREAHASAVAAEQERFAATSLEELIADHVGDTLDVAERARSFGWDLARPRAVLLASIDPPTDPDTLQRSLATIAAAARATLGPHAIVWTRTTTIAALIAPDTGASAERRELAETLRCELDRRLQRVSVSIGVGRTVDHPKHLPRSYVEATRSVDVGRWAKGRHVIEVFDDLGLERLLAATPTDDLADFVERAIGPLVQHDITHDSDLVKTLGVWLQTRNMAKAAPLVHVHYNTFKNRLDRIETILGPVTDDASRALECEVAIYISRHYDGPWTSLDLL